MGIFLLISILFCCTLSLIAGGEEKNFFSCFSTFPIIESDDMAGSERRKLHDEKNNFSQMENLIEGNWQVEALFKSRMR
jgi:hypothetical protein